MIDRLAFSSEIYFIRTAEVQRLAAVSASVPAKYAGETVILLQKDGADKIISGAKQAHKNTEANFIPVRFAYYSYPAWQAFLINLIKPVKRKFYTVFPSVYTTPLPCLLADNLTRGERNEQNAYQWTNKKWHISREEAHRKYRELYDSIKTNGYDAKSPMLIMLNRKFGVKDQLLQGHHRIGICKELNIKEVAVSFWAVPRSFGFLHLFIRRKKQ